MKVLKYLFGGIVLFGVAIYVLVKIADEPLPEGVHGNEAEQLAKRMLEAVNDSAWHQTGAVTWRFVRASADHKYIWDRQRHLAQVEFDDNVVQIDINNRKGIVLSSEGTPSTLDKVELCEKAWRIWVNDSFWLNPVSKAFDPGTTRSIVALEDGTKGLMVSYSSGGVTPGDSYVWLLDTQDRPEAWKFWVSIIPIGGMRFSWSDWIQLSTGAWISTTHSGLIEIRISDVRGKRTLEQLTGVNDLFKPLLENASELVSY